VMAYESLQTRHSIKEIAPRVVVGFLAGALSLWVASQAIEIANGLARVSNDHGFAGLIMMLEFSHWWP
ncbi:MAG: hypothetical protein ACRDZY_02145, partial [Acidimicrobiales bacterium]